MVLGTLVKRQGPVAEERETEYEFRAVLAGDSRSLLDLGCPGKLVRRA